MDMIKLYNGMYQQQSALVEQVQCCHQRI